MRLLGAGGSDVLLLDMMLPDLDGREVLKAVQADRPADLRAVLVLTGDLIARVTAQTCRQSGLSVAYTELLDFGGDEIYFKHEPALAGRSFGEALTAYADSAVIGLRFADGASGPGKYVEMRAAMDVWVLISNCPQLNNPCNAYNPTPIEVLIFN